MSYLGSTELSEAYVCVFHQTWRVSGQTLSSVFLPPASPLLGVPSRRVSPWGTDLGSATAASPHGVSPFRLDGPCGSTLQFSGSLCSPFCTEPIQQVFLTLAIVFLNSNISTWFCFVSFLSLLQLDSHPPPAPPLRVRHSDRAGCDISRRLCPEPSAGVLLGGPFPQEPLFSWLFMC